jgi:putative ABC transport system permease protein
MYLNMFIDFWYEIFEFIKRKPSRAILSSVGIAWGIFILILLVGIGSGFEKGVFKLFKGFSKSTTYVYASETSIGYKGTHIGKRAFFTEDDLQMLKSNIPEITLISPEVSRWGTVYADMKTGWFETRGVYPDYFNIKILEIDSGRILNCLDMQECRKVALIGKNVADVLFKREQPLGKQIRISQDIYQVVGIIKNTILSANEARVVYIPYSTYRKSRAEAEQFTPMLFASKDKADSKKINDRVRSFMARKYQFDPSDEKVFYFNSMEEQVKAFTDLFVTLKKFLWFMGISTLISGVIGVGNIMYSTAKERTREIGIRKSVGASSASIKIMFIWESIALTSVAGYLGILLGWLFLKGIGLFITEDTVMMEKPGLDLPTAIAAMLILIISGTLAGLKPAMYASELNPIEALKEET